MVLVKKIKCKRVLIYDPKIGIYELKKDKFLELWNSEILEIESIGSSNYKESYSSPVPLKNKIIFLFQSLEIFHFDHTDNNQT